MRAFTFILFMVLIALLGLLTVHAEAERTRSAYRVGKLLARREILRQRKDRVERDLAFLKSPRHLMALNRDLDLKLEPISPIDRNTQQQNGSSTASIGTP